MGNSTASASCSLVASCPRENAGIRLPVLLRDFTAVVLRPEILLSVFREAFDFVSDFADRGFPAGGRWLGLGGRPMRRSTLIRGAAVNRALPPPTNGVSL